MKKNHTPTETAAESQITDAVESKKKTKWRFERRFLLIALGLLVLFVFLVWWNLFRSPPMTISRETTFITEPLRADGKTVDYVAYLNSLLPPETRTDENGVRLLLQSFHDDPIWGSENFSEAYSALGLDPAAFPPAVHHECPYAYLKTFLKKKYPGEDITERRNQFMDRYMDADYLLDPNHDPEADDFRREWLALDGSALDRMAEACNKKCFAVPLLAERYTIGQFEGPSISFVQYCRAISRELKLRAVSRIMSGDISGAVDDRIAIHRLARHLLSPKNSYMLSFLVGIAINGIAADIPIGGNPDAPPSADDLRRLDEAVREGDSVRKQAVTAFSNERFFALEWVQAAAVTDKIVSSEQPLPWSLWRYLGFNWDVVLKEINRIYDSPNPVAEMKKMVENLQKDGLAVVKNGEVRRPTWRLLRRALTLRGRDDVARYYLWLLMPVVLPAVESFQKASERADCQTNLCRIALAMLQYRAEHGTLPPAWTVDGDGRPLHSWRVLILPYLGEEEKTLYGKIHLDEPWDSDYNRQFHFQNVPNYVCPSVEMWQKARQKLGQSAPPYPQPGETTYSVIVGENTLFDGTGVGIDPVARQKEDPANNPLGAAIVTERTDPVCWMKPDAEITQDAALAGICDFDKKSYKPGMISSFHTGGAEFALADGRARFVAEQAEEPILRQLILGERPKENDKE